MTLYKGGTVSRVVTYTDNNQGDSDSAGTTDGGWVVVWGSIGQDGSDSGIYMQKYNSAGVTVGSETIVNTTTADSQSYPSVAGLTDGGWVVTWESPNGGGDGIYFQRFDASGNEVGSETQANTYTTDSKFLPTITALNDGGWVIAWTSFNQPSDSNRSAHMQRYDSAGATVGSEVRINTTTADWQQVPVLTALSDGGWVATWEAHGQDGDGFGVFQQRYSSSGATVGSETQVNTNVPYNQLTSTVAGLADGGWVVSWESKGDQDGDGIGVYMQRYSSAGVKVGTEVQVNTTTAGDQIRPDIVGLADGGWVVVWQSENVDGSDYAAVYQVYDSTGAAVGSQQTSNTTFSSRQGDVSVAATPAGFVITFTDYGNAAEVSQRVFVTSTIPTSADSTRTANEDSAVYFSTSDFSFADVDGDTLAAIVITELPDSGTLKLSSVTVTLGQVIAVSNIWKLVWRPPANEHGDGFSEFKFKVQDSYGDVSTDAYTMTLNVASVADAPVTANKTVTLIEDGSYTFAIADFTYSDGDGEAFTSIIVTTLPANGSLTLDGVEVTLSQVIVVADIADLVWTPDANVNGSGAASMGFKVNDSSGSSSTARTITFDVTSVDDDPTAADATITIDEDGSHSFAAEDFSFADVDGDTLASVIITALPETGTLLLDGVAVTLNQAVAAADLSKLVWAPAANAHGDAFASLTFTVTDSDGASSSEHTLTFDVTSVVDAPEAVDGSVTIVEDGSHAFATSDFSFSDGDGDALASITIMELPASGTLALDGVPVTQDQVIVHDDIGSLVWTPDADDNGTGLATLGFRITDTGGQSSVTKTLTFHVTAVVDAPTSSDSLVSTDEDAAYFLSAADFEFADIDSDTLAAIVIGTLGSGALTLDGDAVVVDQEIAVANLDKLVWTPAANAHGEGIAAFTFRVKDSTGALSVAAQAFTVDVAAVNDDPVAIADTAALTEGTTTTINVLDNDTDIDMDTLSLDAATVTSGNGSVTFDADGELVITYSGADIDKGATTQMTITYDLSDGMGGTATGSLTVTVTGVSEPGDPITGTNKDDTLVGTEVAETISGGKGDDRLLGKGGEDSLIGGVGDDILYGNDGDDEIDGDLGDDILRGNGGNDLLNGGGGNDQLNGGDGNDRLAGWGDNDRLTGGSGADIFVFHKSGGKDVITDFETGGKAPDKIDLSNLDSFSTFRDVKDAMRQSGGSTVIEYGNNSITLQGVDVEDFSKGHFIF
jgi:Ca2+-binding RTX toxin-like protein